VKNNQTGIWEVTIKNTETGDTLAMHHSGDDEIEALQKNARYWMTTVSNEHMSIESVNLVDVVSRDGLVI
jgi:hypothetical protein